MTEPGNLEAGVLLETSTPKGAASLESILRTEELRNRPSRSPNHKRENSALVALASALADSPRTILQTLADKVLDVLNAGSAGLSLLTKDGRSFYSPAIAGAWRSHIGESTPRDFGPSGDVLDQETPLLFSHWERRYPYFDAVTPLAEEALVVPFSVEGRPIGTIWAVAHNNLRKFDAEDSRLLESIGRFASAAYQVVQAIEALSVEITARARAQSELRELTDNLEARARELADEQAALRRVATLVAQGASPEELFAAVANEVAGIIDIPVVSVNRYEADGTFTMLGIAGETNFTVGSRWPVEEEGIAGIILATGRPARRDDYSGMPGRLGQAVREDLMVSTVGVPIVVEGSIWGFMGAAAKPGRPIPADTEAQLAQFTELIATAVSNATTRADLLMSRARVVSAADETRRRLERDLHDGIQQWLIALALRARKAAGLSAAGESPLQELSGLADELVAVTDELREISRGIHPAILSEAGLDDALKALARRSAIRVDLDVAFQGRYDPTVEATVYYVVAESITNAVKHAQASAVAVRGGLRGDAIELEIKDDGVGGADPGRGTGLLGLKDRIDTLGGAISFASPAGAGTTVRVRLPASPLDRATTG
jgi:signal transduction histidine kinase